MRSTGIKAIETHYNGYRFRSRLEARWAVYFDALGIEYEYEPEGFVLPGGASYLPDFYLPIVDAYVEIKSRHSTEINAASDKLFDVAEQTGKYGLFCTGDPVDNNMKLCGMFILNDCKGMMWKPTEFIIGAEEISDDFAGYHKVFEVGLVINDTRIADVKKFNGERIRTVIPRIRLFGYERLPYEEQERARQARFEHGECG